MRFTPTRALCVVAAVAALLNMTTPALAFGGSSIRYVDDDAPAGGNGSSWDTAFNDLQTALEAASAPGSGITEIRVAQGRYVPTHLTDPSDPRSAVFQLLNDVALKGGYAGIGAGDPNANDPVQFESILSGDVNGDDQPDFVNTEENTYHVLIASGTTGTAVLDGFIIECAYADGEGFYPDSITYIGATLNISGDPTIAHCTFRKNWARVGGAMYNRQGASPSIHHCRFEGNYAVDRAGAIRNYDQSSPVIDSCVFIGNSGEAAGAISFDAASNVILSNCEFTDNTAGAGGALHVSGSPVAINVSIINSTFTNNSTLAGGGAAVLSATSQTTITHCVFEGNTTEYVGGALVISGPATINNCTFAHNESGWLAGGVMTAGGANFTNCLIYDNAADIGGGLYIAGTHKVKDCTIVANINGGVVGYYLSEAGTTTLVVKNSIVWNNVGSQVGPSTLDPPTSWNPTIQYSDVQGIASGTNSNNINLDPMFVQPGCGNFRLAYGSPCINAGYNATIPAGITTDLDDQPRIQDGIVDMGAYEGGHEPLPLTACEEHLDQGYVVKLVPTGNAFDPVTDSAIRVENTAGPDNSWVDVTQIDDPLHEGAGAHNELGSILSVQTSIPDSQFFTRVYIPFNQSNLGGFDPLLVDLTYFDPQTGDWQLAASANTQNSPGHAGPLGDRIVTVGTQWNTTVTFDLGDYGVFWNPSMQQGFVWANVDHASDFAFGVKLPDCAGDCAYPLNNIVNHDDVTAVINAWGMTPSGPASFADINHDGIINAADLLAVLNAWGPCP